MELSNKVTSYLAMSNKNHCKWVYNMVWVRLWHDDQDAFKPFRRCNPELFRHPLINEDGHSCYTGSWTYNCSTEYIKLFMEMKTCQQGSSKYYELEKRLDNLISKTEDGPSN